MRILTFEEMRRVEAAADASGHSYVEMMERAGRGVADAVMARVPANGRRVLVLVGPGNNGGDGLVAARHLAQAGAEVACYLLKPRSDDDPNYRAIRELELFVADAANDQRWRVLRRIVAGADVIIDALLGTGARLPLQGTVADLMRQVSAGLKARRAEQAAARALLRPARPPAALASALIVAVDGPSGLDYDSGELDPLALPADLTVTFASQARAFFVPRRRGRWRVGRGRHWGGLQTDAGSAGPSDPPGCYVRDDQANLARPSPRRAQGYFWQGAACRGVDQLHRRGLSGRQRRDARGRRAGHTGDPRGHSRRAGGQNSEATYLVLPQAMGVIAPNAVGLLTEKMIDYTAMLLGCGLTQEKETVEFVHRVFQADVSPKRKGRIGFQAGGAGRSG